MKWPRKSGPGGFRGQNPSTWPPSLPSRGSRSACLRRTGRDAGPASQARVTCGHARPTVIGRALRCRYGKKFELMASVTPRFFFLLSALSSATGRVTLFVRELNYFYAIYFHFHNNSITSSRKSRGASTKTDEVRSWCQSLNLQRDKEHCFCF